MRSSVFAVVLLLAIASPASAQLVGDDTAPGSSCAGFPDGATRMTADADLDGAQVVLICNGSVWQTSSGSAAAPNRGIQFNSGNSLAASPDLVFSSSGFLGVGTPDPWANLQISGNDQDTMLVVSNDSSTTDRWPAIDIRNYSGTTDGTPALTLFRARGSIDTPSPLQASDAIGHLSFMGHKSGSPDWGIGSWIFSTASANWDGTSTSAQLQLATTPPGETWPTTRMTITDIGNVGVGTETPASALHVSGGIAVGHDPAACTAAKDGTIRYSTSGTLRWEYCDGGAENWRPFEHAAGGACSPPPLCPNVGDVCDDSNPATTDDPVFAGFVIEPVTSNECRALFVPPTHQGSGVQWSTVDGVDHIANDSMWDGRVNDAQIPDSANFPAAKLCKDLVSGGFDDWYLPAKEELDVISYNRAAIAASSEAWGWNIVSSNEADNDRVWMFALHATQDGTSGAYGKTQGVYSVRCVRTESVSGTGGALNACVGPADCPQIGNVCTDGSVFAGCNPATGMPLLATRCDAGRTYGTSCTGGRATRAWNNANSSGHVNTNIRDQADGRANTAALQAGGAQQDSDTAGGIQEHRAAQYCADLSIHGQTDWYLPAEFELLELFRNKSAIGDFTNNGNQYWSSTETSTTTAYGMDPTTNEHGVYYYETKQTAKQLRCIRQGVPMTPPVCTDDYSGRCLLDGARDDSDPEFLAANIASGVNILGVTGTMTGGGGSSCTVGESVGYGVCGGGIDGKDLVVAYAGCPEDADEASDCTGADGAGQLMSFTGYNLVHGAAQDVADGEAATSKLIVAEPDGGVAHYCRSLSIGGRAWHVPSVAELAVIYKNRNSGTWADAAFLDDIYWAAGGEDDNFAYSIDFDPIETKAILVASNSGYLNQRIRCITYDEPSSGGSGACPAGGVEVGGACWYQGWRGQSCTTVCTARGLTYSDATRDYAGSGGNVGNCTSVLNALGLAGSAVNEAECGGYGCVFYGGTERNRCTASSTTAAAAEADTQRVCACE